MSLVKDEENDLTNNMQHDDKGKVEQVFINVGCVKEELEEEVLDERNKGIDPYKVELKYEDVLEENLDTILGNGNKSIGLVDENILMNETIIKSEENIDFKPTYSNNFYCNKCGGNYQGYCLNCSSLSHILNHILPDLDTIPTNILEIRDISMRKGVFTLKTLPKNVIFGPFEGLSTINSTNGNRWKIKDCKLANEQNGNWMKYVVCATNRFSTNLNIFQFDRYLYYETNRVVQEGEELVTCFGEEVNSDYEEECFFVPVKKEEFPKIFACTLCCLGFRLESCLMEHKSRCPHENHKENIEDFEIIECHCCKIWLEKQEHLERHMHYCLEHYKRVWNNLSNFQWVNRDDVGETHGNNETSTSNDEDGNTSSPDPIINFTKVEMECPENPYENGATTNFKDAEISVKNNYVSKHLNEQYKCLQCTFQTLYKSDFEAHLITHVRTFPCNVCKKKFRKKLYLKRHFSNIHLNLSGKKYKCTECCFQAKQNCSLKLHILNKHSDIREMNYKCSDCSFRTNHKGNLKRHLYNKHSNVIEKNHKCPECPYETNYKGNLKLHLQNKHSNITKTTKKNYKCSECFYETQQKGTLKLHVLNKHSGIREKNHKCLECSYQTNYKRDLDQHLNTHRDKQKEKDYKCAHCSYETFYKQSLKRHLIIHSNAREKKFKCSQCSYESNHKSDLERHLNTHKDVKPFQCDICVKSFSQKRSLKYHVQKIHSNIKEEDFE